MNDRNSTEKSPVLVVSDVEYELQRLSGMCNLLAQIQNCQDTVVDLEIVGDTMRIIRDILDAQIRALDAIQWPKKEAGAA